jgi:2-polyprenyl-3-methyl-5-hydroxy-6-metoxy-1,4-benzoquinol methylase
MSVDAPPRCPLCAEGAPVLYVSGRARSFWRCGRCALVFVPPSARPDAAAERARYDTHRNDPADAGYRRFLSRLAGPLLARVAPGAEGLDFGCGPGPALAAMLREQGLKVALYDPFYAPDASVLARAYDFVTATEVLEHLHRPADALDRLFGLLKPGGWLGVMTQSVRPPEALDAWHYARDPTHVCFYSRETFAYIGARWRAEPVFVEDDVVLFEKEGTL